MNSSLPALNVDFLPESFVRSINPQVVAVVLLLVACVFCFSMSVVLLYHWKNYGMSNSRIALARIVYLSVTILILCLSIVSIIFI